MFEYSDYIYEIYKEKSFTKAAKNLFISQPALSATVKKLEEKMQVQIFDRSVTPLRLTSEGEAYIKAIEEIFSIKKDYENFIVDVSNLNLGSVSVSGTYFITSHILPKIIAPFSEKHPMISINLVESNSKTLLKFLIEEKVELLIDYSYDKEQIDAFPLFDEMVLLCVPKSKSINSKLKDYALTSKDIRSGKHLKDTTPSLSASTFKNEKFLMMKAGYSMNFIGFNVCREAGFTPDVAIYFDQLMTSYNMACTGLGACFASDTLVSTAPQNDDLLYYKLESSHVTRTAYLLHKKKRYLNKACQEFIKVAQEVYGKGNAKKEK